MKTSILFGRNYNRRAFLPDEMPGDEKSKLFRHPTFHKAETFEAESISITATGLKSNGKHKVHRPDSIIIGDYTFELGLVKNRIAACKPHRTNGAICGAVVIGPEYAAQLDELDQQIARLQAEQRDVMAEAAKRGKPLARQDLDHSKGD